MNIVMLRDKTFMDDRKVQKVYSNLQVIAGLSEIALKDLVQLCHGESVKIFKEDFEDMDVILRNYGMIDKNNEVSDEDSKRIILNAVDQCFHLRDPRHPLVTALNRQWSVVTGLIKKIVPGSIFGRALP